MKKPGFYRRDTSASATSSATGARVSAQTAPASTGASLSSAFNAQSGAKVQESNLNGFQVLQKIANVQEAPKADTGSMMRDATKAAGDLGNAGQQAIHARATLNESKAAFDKSLNSVKTEIGTAYMEAAKDMGYHTGDAMNALVTEGADDFLVKTAASNGLSTAMGLSSMVGNTIDVAGMVAGASKLTPKDVQDIMASAVSSLQHTQEQKKQEFTSAGAPAQNVNHQKHDYSNVTGADAVKLMQTPNEEIAKQAGFDDAYTALDAVDNNHKKCEQNNQNMVETAFKTLEEEYENTAAKLTANEIFSLTSLEITGQKTDITPPTSPAAEKVANAISVINTLTPAALQKNQTYAI